jgi:prepilin-type N-terminal cleavage/methylation domain-containing protein
MRLHWYLCRRAIQGFSLIELLVAVAIISILAIVALPNFASYRHKSVVAAVVGTAGDIRAGLAGYASDSSDRLFPLTADVGGWEALRTIVNTHGGSLNYTSAAMGIQTINYTSEDGATYLLQIIVNVPAGVSGRTVSVTPESIAKH